MSSVPARSLDPALDVALDAGPGERLLRHAGIGGAAQIDAHLPARPGARRRAREPARPTLRRAAAERGSRHRCRDGVRLDLDARAGNARRPGGAAARPPHASGRARGAAAARALPPSASNRRGSRSAWSTRLLDGPREVRFRDADGPAPGRDAGGARHDEASERSAPRRARSPRVSVRSSCRASAASSGSRVDARFVVEGTTCQSRARRARQEARCRPDRASHSSRTCRRVPIWPGSWRSQPKLTTEEAKKLRITELVSEFTTNYPCCAPRVTNIKRAATLLDGTIILPGQGVLPQRRARQAHQGEGLRVRAADLQRPLRGCSRRRHQPGCDDALQRRVLLRDQARRPPGAPVLHLAVPDGTRGDRLLGRARADLPQRLARRDPDEARRERQRHHGALLLHEARAARHDDDGAAVRPDDAEDRHRDELRAGARVRGRSCRRRATAASRSTTRGRSSATARRSATSATRSSTTPRTRSWRSARASSWQGSARPSVVSTDDMTSDASRTIRAWQR